MKKVSRLVVCVFVLAGVSYAQAGKEHPPTSLTGSEIIQIMAEKYTSAKSYQDTGTVVRGSANGSPNDARVLTTFSTFFARPEFYRFQWKSNDDNVPGWKVIWTAGDYFSTLNANGDRQLEVDRDVTVARAAAGTRGASQTIAALLSGTVRGFRVSNMSEVTLLREEQFESTNCYVVRGHHPLGFAIDLWVGKDDFLIRKIRQINGDGSYQDEIRREVKLDVPIPAEIFQYKSKKTAPKNIT
jgi:outer membrane lipoprotein-sorting protein